MPKGSVDLAAPIPKRNKETLTTFVPETQKNKTPQIGITYICTGDHCLCKLHAMRDPSLFRELQDFIDKFRKEDTISLAISRYISHINGKNNDKISLRKLRQLNQKFHTQIDSMIHLHTELGGKGPYTLHGFRNENTFEIIWIDPFHEIYGKK
jgi:hypothetical protein